MNIGKAGWSRLRLVEMVPEVQSFRGDYGNPWNSFIRCVSSAGLECRPVYR